MGSAAVETLALIVVDKNFQKVSAQKGIDPGHLENLISCLENQIDSFKEVVLQNGRGLGLLFTKQGCLCMALEKLVASMLTSQG